MLELVRETFPSGVQSLRRPVGSSSALRVTVRESNASRKSATRQINAATTKLLSILGWYRILRAHDHWTVLEAIRYAVWLTQ